MKESERDTLRESVGDIMRERERQREGETIKFRIYPSFSDDFFMVEHVKASI